MFWEERGLGESGERVSSGNQLGVIGQMGATAVPSVVTAAEPRELRIDPCEKKSKGATLGIRRAGRPAILPGNCRTSLGKTSRAVVSVLGRKWKEMMRLGA